jgi:hypothetical protein
MLDLLFLHKSVHFCQVSGTVHVCNAVHKHKNSHSSCYYNVSENDLANIYVIV